MKRSIITIDEKKCDGCGQCIPNCPEGALQVIDGKARLVSDLFCDGLGACVGHCPTGAMKVVKREAEAYDEAKVMSNIVKHGPNTISAHLAHLKDHGAERYYKEAVSYLRQKKIAVPAAEKPCCPSMTMRQMPEERPCCPGASPGQMASDPSLRQWPIQLRLLSPSVPFFKDAEVLIAADCTAFASARFHDILKGRALAISCPKFDDISASVDKLTAILKDAKSVTVAVMEVPCCTGLHMAVEEAVRRNGNRIPLKKVIISIKGEVCEA
jgi:NAD-dependent dihydropyrimidine dehydrogenase PreA subunit